MSKLINYFFEAKGRLGRMEFFIRQCALGGVAIGLSLLVFVMEYGVSSMKALYLYSAVSAIGVISVVIMVYASFCLMVRRLHDMDLSGWFILLFFIPYLGILLQLPLFFIPGTKGKNDFGQMYTREQ